MAALAGQLAVARKNLVAEQLPTEFDFVGSERVVFGDGAVEVEAERGLGRVSCVE